MNLWLIAALWVGLALFAAMLSIRVGIAVALVEIGVGVLAGNFLHLRPNDWVNFLASVGSVLLTRAAQAGGISRVLSIVGEFPTQDGRR